MDGRGFVIGAALVAAVFSARGSPVLADGPPAAQPAADEAAFLASLDLARRALAAGSASEGLKAVDQALLDHKGRDYARARRPDLEDLVHRLAFRAECPPPDPKTLVKGDLKRFVSRSGDFEIRYQAGKPTDFETKGDSLFFPSRFRGPYTVTVKGDAYPDRPEGVPFIQVGWEEDPKTRRVQAWGISFGIPPWAEGRGKAWLPARILKLDGEERKTLVEKQTPAVANKPYRLDVQVGLTRIAATIDGSPIGSAPKPAGVWGYTLVRAPNWREIAISGTVEPSWIQSKVDAIVDAKRKAFDAKFDVRKRLPAWLYEGPAPSAAPVAPRVPSLPAGVASLPPAFVPEYEAAVARLAAGDAEGALEAAEALRRKGAPDSVTGVLAARALVDMDEPAKALVEADRALAADPAAVEALVVKAGILRMMGRDEDLVATLASATARPGATCATFEAAGTHLLFAGRLDEARATVEAAIKRGERSPVLDSIGRAVVRAQNGPDWPSAFEHRTANYRVCSDMDPETCRQAALALEDALADFRIHVKQLPPERKRLYRVFLFSGEAGFKRYADESSVLEGKGPERAAGLYSTILKQLLIWSLPNRDEMMRTVRHEGFHQYFDRLLPDPPIWFNEGLAVYFEAATKVGGELKADAPRHDYLKVLAARPLVPLEDFLHVTPREFYATAPHSYAQAWLVVHLLRHGPVKVRDLYRGLLSRLESSSGSEAVRAVFGDGSLAWLDDALKAHLAALAARK